MNEWDMKYLLWNHPDRLLGEPLRKLKREAKAGHGLADLVFEDKDERVLIVEVKLGTLPRSAIGQILEYKSAMKGLYPEKQKRVLVVAFTVPDPLKAACEDAGIEFREISEDIFRDLARKVDHRLTETSRPRFRKHPTNRLGRLAGRPAAQKTSRSRTPKQPVKYRVVRVPCPVVPEAAWYGESRLYRQALVESTEASDNFHLALFLTAAGAGLGKSVYVEEPERVYPNLYCVLVGQTGSTCKTTAIHRAEKLLREFSPNVRWFDHFIMGSAEGLIKWVRDELKDAEGEATPAIMICPMEIESLIEGHHQGGPKIIGLLRDLHRSMSRLEVNSLHSPIKIEHLPSVSLFGESMRLDWFRNLQRRNLSRGIADCMMFVCGDPKGPIALPRRPSLEPWNQLVTSMDQICKFWSERGGSKIHLDEEARRTWVAFNSRVRDEAGTDTSCPFVTRQFCDHVLKIALVWAAYEHSDTIKIAHMKAAVSFGDFLFKSVLHIFSLSSTLADE
jgi:hypothetical protein